MCLDKSLQKKVNSLIIEIKEKRDSFPSNSKERKYYRKLSKSMDKVYKVIMNDEEVI